MVSCENLILNVFITTIWVSDLVFVSLSLEAALKKLDPEDGEQIVEYFKTHALLTREKARKSEYILHNDKISYQ